MTFLLVIFALLLHLFHPIPTLHILAWGDALLPQSFTTFAREHGVKIELDTYISNEELLARLQGNGSYDLIIPSDYLIPQLIKQQLIKPWPKDIDLSQIANELLAIPGDPNNIYALPYFWEVIGISPKHPNPNWQMVFSEEKVAMPSDPGENAALATLFLYDYPHKLNLEKQKRITSLLKEQHKNTISYGRGAELFAAGSCRVAILNNAVAWRQQIPWQVPEEGSLYSVESFCLPRGSKHESLVCCLVEELYQPKNLRTAAEALCFIPAIESASNPRTKPLWSMLRSGKLYTYPQGMIDTKDLKSMFLEIKSWP